MRDFIEDYRCTLSSQCSCYHCYSTTMKNRFKNPPIDRTEEATKFREDFDRALRIDDLYKKTQTIYDLFNPLSGFPPNIAVLFSKSVASEIAKMANGLFKNLAKHYDDEFKQSKNQYDALRRDHWLRCIPEIKRKFR